MTEEGSNDSDSDLAEVGSLWARLAQKKHIQGKRIDLTAPGTSPLTVHSAATERGEPHSISSSEGEQNTSSFQSHCQKNEANTKQFDRSSESGSSCAWLSGPQQGKDPCVSSLILEPEPKKRKKRTAEEIEEDRKKAQVYSQQPLGQPIDG